MKRQKKLTRAQKEELSRINEISKAIVESIDYDRKGAIIDEAFRKLDNKAEEVQREKIKLPLVDIDEHEDATGVSFVAVTNNLPTTEVGSDKNVRSNAEVVSQFNTNLSERNANNYCSVYRFERDVMLVEGVMVIVRAPDNAEIMVYKHKKSLSDPILVTEFIRRLRRETSYQYCFKIPGYDGKEETSMGDLRKIQSTFVQMELPIS